MEHSYKPDGSRYDRMKYRRCGRSGLLLPELSFGLWQNFGTEKTKEERRELILTAFDLGITHFDLANNYGPVYGSAEDNFGRIMDSDMRPYRNQMVISTKAGYDMWPGPYGDGGSRKYLISSLDESLQRMKLDYVDIFYHHRMDPETPLEETMLALDSIVKSGKALYAGISNYTGEAMEKAAAILNELKCPFIINQNRYSIFDRTIEENGLKASAVRNGCGIIAFSPLAQGALTGKYLTKIPEDSRAARKGTTVAERYIKEENREKIQRLQRFAGERGQSLAQLALMWVLRRREVTSVLIGASRPEQIGENVKILSQKPLDGGEQEEIDRILASC